jgi:hypothetical protein
MRLRVHLPEFQPDEDAKPAPCPYGCGGDTYAPYGVKGQIKPLGDTGYAEVVSYRHRCLSCCRTFRVYPMGVGSGARQSDRLRGLTVLGMRYGTVTGFTVARGCGVSKTTVYSTVRAAGIGERAWQVVDRRAGINKLAQP